MLNRGQGYRTALATATRGNGGQNEIGPEIFEALGVLRTEELAAMHRFDGAEQYFTRAVDFGYSFSIEETFEKWGRDEITGDYVRLIRTIRPDVIIGYAADGAGGGQHHQASAVITREAFKLAGDPAKYPEQIKDGLRPWQPKKFYSPRRVRIRAASRPGRPGSSRINLARVRPAARQDLRRDRDRSAQHAQVPGHGAAAGAARAAPRLYQLVETTIPGQMEKDEASLFDGVDTQHRRPREVRRRASAARISTDGLAAIASGRPDRAEEVRHRRRRGGAEAAARRACTPCARCAGELRAHAASTTRRDSRSTSGCGRRSASSSRRSLLANGVRVEALADDGVVVPGQPVKVTVIVANRGAGE